MSDNISTESSWPTWKVALVIGVPVAIAGVGVLYYISYSSKKDGEIKKSPPSRTEPEGSSSPIKSTTSAAETISQVPCSVQHPKKTKLQESQELKNEGNSLFKEGLYEKAIKKYFEAIAVCPDNNKTEKATYHQNMAAAMEKMENWTGVIEECTEAINLNQRYVKALHRRAKAFDKIGKKENCLEDITTVCILEGFQNPSTMTYADGVLKELGKERAAEKYQARKPVMPSSLFVKQYFASFSDDVILHPLTEDLKALASSSGYIRAKILLDDGKYPDIITECSSEIEADVIGDTEDKQGFKMEALLLRGTFHLLTGNTKEALRDLDEVINAKDINVKLKANALIKRGSMRMQQQNTDKAESDFTQAIGVDSDNCDVYHHRGQLNILLDKADLALSDFRRCIELKPDFAMAHAQLCYTKYRQAMNKQDVFEAEKVMKEFENIIEKYPTCSETYGLYAQTQTDKENYEKADQLFKQAIAVEPNNATLYVHRGLLALQWKQNLDEAVKLISQALEIDDKCDFAHETMGTIEVQRGNLDEATKHFDVSIEFAKTEAELAHLYALQAAAFAQANIARKYGLRPPVPPGVV